MTLEANIELIASLMAAQQFIFMQTANESWVGKFEISIRSLRNILDDFRKELAGEECDTCDDFHEDLKEKGKSEELDEDVSDVAAIKELNHCNDDDMLTSSGIKEDSVGELIRSSEQLNVTEEIHQMSGKEGAVDHVQSLKCSLCGKVFQCREDLSKHDNKSHKVDGQFQCPEDNCKKLMSTRNNLLDHFHGLHSTTSQNNCDECGKTFKSHLKLYCHIRYHHDKRVYTCNHCFKEFPNKIRYHQHIRLKHEYGPVTCEHCGVELAGKPSLDYHLASVHKKGEEIKCPYCYKVFYRGLKKHISGVHGNQSRFRCNKCDYRCSRKTQLAQHSTTHMGEEARTEVCEQCGAKFKKKDVLTVHIKRVHKKIKDHKCEACGKAFFSKTKMLQHVKIHTGEMDFSCQHCLKQFNQKCNRDTHEKRAHASPL